MEKFFRDVMLDEHAIYTLCGTKPITTMPIYYYTDEEVDEYYAQMTEEEIATAVIVEDYDLSENWEKWEKIRSQFPLSRYFFFKRDDPEDSRFAFLVFVDVAATVKMLQENYSVFCQETGMDFDPQQVVFEMEAGSEFWDKTFDNCLLVGLLYGFGLKNAYSFRDKYKDVSQINESLSSYASDEPTFRTATIEHFSLPIFASFSGEKDEVIEKYKKEKADIQKIYQGQDFLELTLQKMLAP